jgi:hypothetical protein
MGDLRVQNFIKTEENNFVFMKKILKAFVIITTNQYDSYEKDFNSNLYFYEKVFIIPF